MRLQKTSVYSELSLPGHQDLTLNSREQHRPPASARKTSPFIQARLGSAGGTEGVRTHRVSGIRPSASAQAVLHFLPFVFIFEEPVEGWRDRSSLEREALSEHIFNHPDGRSFFLWDRHMRTSRRRNWLCRVDGSVL